MELSNKQKKFADAYIKLQNGTQAAIEAGYPESSAAVRASENLKKPYIVEYIQERSRELEEKSIASIKDCLKLLTSTMNDENASTADRLRACDMRLKSLGAYLDRVQTNTDVVINISVDED